MEDINSLIKIRIDKINEIREVLKINPYPYTYNASHISSEIIDDYEKLFASQETVSLAGRVMAVRDMGKAAFLSILDRGGRMQIYISNKNLNEQDYKLFEKIDMGDIIGARGVVKKTKVGEITVFASELTMLTKSIRPLPVVKEKDGVTFDLFSDKELRYRNRPVDLIVTPGVKETFQKRLMIIKNIKGILDGKNFLEVETPILQPIYGGAAASPFTTHHNALDIQLFMRISPEPYLKRLIVGGFDRVYEMGKCFRNEGIDRTHNPEFTILEIYQAYADYEVMMNLTEELITDTCMKVNGSLETEFSGKKIDFKKPWQRLKMADALKEFAGMDIESMSDDEIEKKLKSHGGEVKGGYVRGLAIDSLFKILVEEKLIQPVFITHHPVETTPLCKPDFSDERYLQRFELFINGTEFANGYSESNDPLFQRKTLYEQSLRRDIDDEAPPMDENFIQAIETGMPPTGGLGIGIDRLVMILTGEVSIRDVLFFPTMKPE